MPSKPSAKPAKTTKSLAKAAKPAAKPAQSHAAQPKAKKPSAAPPPVRRAPPPEPPKPVLTMEERTTLLEERLLKTAPEFQQEYRDNLDMSWIYHDSAIEGVVYTFQELKTAIDPTAQVVADSSLQPACEEIRRHREALNFIRDYAPKKRQPVTVDLLKRIYLILHPEEGDLKTVRYRKDIPQHRLYFHEYAPPDKITYKVRAVVEWANDPETRRTRSPIRLAARAHYDLLRVFPFPNDSGKVARLFMNLLLLRAGYPPAIVHSTERQRYYEALKGSSAAMTQIVQEAIDNNLASVEKLLDTHEAALKEKELEA
jgi:Fic family protein